MNDRREGLSIVFTLGFVLAALQAVSLAYLSSIDTRLGRVEDKLMNSTVLTASR